MRSRLILAAVLSAVTVGCAYVTHEPVTYHPYSDTNSPEDHQTVKLQNDEEDRKKIGIRYYLSSPYLLVYSDGKGNLVWKIYNLPDQARLMVATPTQFLAKTTANLTFSNGVLTNSHTETDSSTTLKSVIGALEKVLPLLIAADSPGEMKIPAPQLYKIVVDQDHNVLKLISKQNSAMVSVTLKPGS